MPSKTEKQRKFFGAVMGAKKGQKGISKKAQEVAKEMPKKEIKKFLKLKKGKTKNRNPNNYGIELPTIKKTITPINSKNNKQPSSNNANPTFDA